MRELMMWLAMVSVFAIPATGCDDEEPNALPDTTADATEDQPTTDQPNTDTITPPAECYTARTGDSFVTEPLGEDEYADCITGCDHDALPYIADLARLTVDGIRGAGTDWPSLVGLHDGDAKTVHVDRRGIAHRDRTTSGVDAIRSGHDTERRRNVRHIGSHWPNRCPPIHMTADAREVAGGRNQTE